MVKPFVIIVCFFLPLQVVAQVLDFGTPEKLSQAVNSDAEESMPLLSPDGKMLFFTRALSIDNFGGKYTGQDIWVSEQIDSDWKKADNTKAGFNNKNNNVVIGMSGSGDVVYLMDASSTQKVSGIYFSKRTSNAWSKPEFIPVSGIESNGFLNFYMSPDFDVLFISMTGKDTKGEEDIYVSIKGKGASGEWSKPKNLGPAINSAGFEISPFLSSDKKRLYFSSNGHSGLGDADIFVSERLYDSWEIWSIPQNLGNSINSPKFDAYFSIYRDSICFLASNRDGKLSDLYQARVLKEKSESGEESTDRIIAEANMLLSELSDSEDRKAIVFLDKSFSLTDPAKSELNKLISKVRGSVRILYTFDIEIHEQVENESKDDQSLLAKRTNEIRTFLTRAGVLDKDIKITVTDSDSRLKSPRYVVVSIKSR